jgi:ATP-dependent RNA helicase SUPV3L1/SUV3
VLEAPAPDVTAAVEAATAPDAAVVSEATETAATSDAAPAEAATAEAEPDTPATPELVEVWRPGGRSDERRPHHDRHRHRHHGRHDRSAEGTAPAAAAGEGGEAAAREPRHRRGRRHNEFRKPREGAPVEAGTTPPAEGAPAQEVRQEARHEARADRPPRERFEGKGKDNDNRREKFGGDRNKGDRNKGDRDRGGRDKGRDFGSRDKRDRDSGPSHRQYATSAAPRDRDRPIDPNSPFAKLAALREQLAGNKDR